jgi:hypothetical protein
VRPRDGLDAAVKGEIPFPAPLGNSINEKQQVRLHLELILPQSLGFFPYVFPTTICPRLLLLYLPA